VWSPGSVSSREHSLRAAREQDELAGAAEPIGETKKVKLSVKQV
jgi:hypothetical protein